MRNRSPQVIVMILVFAAQPANWPPSVAGSNGFQADVSRITSRLEDRMSGRSWHRGCPNASLRKGFRGGAQPKILEVVSLFLSANDKVIEIETGRLHFWQ